MATQNPGPAAKTVWTYAYQIVPPQTVGRLAAIKNLLEHEHADARREARTWVGRVVLERQITNILVVSDSPEQNRAVNRRLEVELKLLNVGFSITAPLAVANAAAPPSPESKGA